MEFKETAPCYVCWCVTIAIGVAGGSLFADAVRAGIAYASMVSITNKLTGKVYNPSPYTKTPRLTIPTKTAKDMSGYRTTVETCNFWKDEYSKNPTSKSKTYRDTACNRLKKYR